MKLFCLPYAGGSSVIYTTWKNYVDSSIELCPIELAGRGKRFQEPLYNTIKEMVEDVYEQIKDDIEKDSYAIFGHSMGSIIAYELCHKLEEKNTRKPVHVFFSGHKAPSIIKDDEIIHDLPDEEFKNKLIELGGTPKEFFESKELCDMFIPIIRADFKAVENYTYNSSNDKLNINISVLYGKKEEMTMNEILQWRNHTNGETKIYPFEGDHFFINDNSQNIVNIINHTLFDNM